MLRRARGEDNEKRVEPARDGTREIRVGDWTCKTEACRGWSNFKWRTLCLKCGKSPRGALGQKGSAGEESTIPGLSAIERHTRRLEEEGEPVRRPQRMIIITINLLIGNTTRIRPHNRDHIQILKQAGLSLGEVTGIVAKIGYLEVSLIPGAVSGAGAQRETHKQVNDNITITSIKERGSNRVVQVRYQDVLFEVLGETRIQYTELYANVERAGRRMRWKMIREEDNLSPGGELVGKWTGERSELVTLKRDVGRIPTWHFVGGGRIRVHVPSKRNCPRCLQSVNECEANKVQKGDWKKEQDKFLEGLGWTEKKQIMMEELEQKEADGLEIEEQDEAELRAAEEQVERAAEEKEGLVQISKEGRQCGGILFRNFPETAGERKHEKKEVLLTVIVASNLSEQEQKRLQEAEIVLTRTNRGKKSVLDVKISMPAADALLRKLWDRLEKTCKQENVKQYQIEASTPMTPVKEKPLTELRKAREMVRKIMKENEERNVQEKKNESKKMQTEGVTNLAPLVMEVQQESIQQTGDREHNAQHKEGGGLPEGSYRA